MWAARSSARAAIAIATRVSRRSPMPKHLLNSTTRILPKSASIHIYHLHKRPPIIGRVSRYTQRSELFSVNLVRHMAAASTSNGSKDVEKTHITQPSILKRAARQLLIYTQLGKFRLSSEVLVTTIVGYLVAPHPVPLDWWHLGATTLGTWMAIWSANSINQIMEAEHDAKMLRTTNRIIPQGLISKQHALGFAITSGLLGTGILATQVNMISAALALANIVLYTAVYTPLKRKTPLNTWIGSFVGALPPVIGWAAATGHVFDSGAMLLAAVLYIWQIPHFLALSWRLKEDYARAGYEMLSTCAPHKVAPQSLWYTLAMLPLGAVAAATGLTTGWFALDGAAVVLSMAWPAWKFYKDPGSRTADGLFFSSLWFLPLWFTLLILHRKKDPPAEQHDGEKD